jgi:predicted RNase H-like HicB family nuclease
MKMKQPLTAIVEREGEGYVALCPELDIASQGDTFEEAQSNLREALALFFEEAPPEEVERRLRASPTGARDGMSRPSAS